MILWPHLCFLWAFKQKYFSSRTHFLYCIFIFLLFLPWLVYPNLKIFSHLNKCLIVSTVYSALDWWVTLICYLCSPLTFFRRVACIFMFVLPAQQPPPINLAVACGYSHLWKPCLNLSMQTPVSSNSDVCISLLYGLPPPPASVSKQYDACKTPLPVWALWS